MIRGHLNLGSTALTGPLKPFSYLQNLKKIYYFKRSQRDKYLQNNNLHFQ